MTVSPRETLDSGIRYLVDERRVISGIAVSYGGLRGGEQFCYGNIREVSLQEGAFVPDLAPMDENSVFDLASVSKLFTCIAVLQLCERKKIALSSTIGSIDKRFLHIADVTVEELLSFEPRCRPRPASTRRQTPNKRKSCCSTSAPAPRRKEILHGYGRYGAQVYRRVRFRPFLLGIPAAEHPPPARYGTYLCGRTAGALPNTVCYNYERTVAAGRHCVDIDCPAGTIHDPKARLLRTLEPGPFGHAGLFSTLPDMTRLANGLLQNTLFSRETLLSIGVNRTAARLRKAGIRSIMGYLCYSKHPVQTFSEVPASFGERTNRAQRLYGQHFFRRARPEPVHDSARQPHPQPRNGAHSAAPTRTTTPKPCFGTTVKSTSFRRTLST